VLVTLTSETGLKGQEHLSADLEPEMNRIRVGLQPENFDHDHLLTIEVDPDGEIPEAHDDNNSFAVKIRVPAQDSLDVANSPCTKVTPSPTFSTPFPQGGSDGATPLSPQTDPAVILE
jgi:hypothetical protein